MQMHLGWLRIHDALSGCIMLRYAFAVKARPAGSGASTDPASAKDVQPGFFEVQCYRRRAWGSTCRLRLEHEDTQHEGL